MGTTKSFLQLYYHTMSRNVTTRTILLLGVTALAVHARTYVGELNKSSPDHMFQRICKRDRHFYLEDNDTMLVYYKDIGGANETGRINLANVNMDTFQMTDDNRKIPGFDKLKFTVWEQKEKKPSKKPDPTANPMEEKRYKLKLKAHDDGRAFRLITAAIRKAKKGAFTHHHNAPK